MGWGEAQLAAATPDFLDALRWVAFVEALDVRNLPPPDARPPWDLNAADQKLAWLRLMTAAGELRALIFPPDEPEESDRGPA